MRYFFVKTFYFSFHIRILCYFEKTMEKLTSSIFDNLKKLPEVIFEALKKPFIMIQEKLSELYEQNQSIVNILFGIVILICVLFVLRIITTGMEIYRGFIPIPK
jgi:branched-subunit amino acid transport protein